jgi:hypothetical protein
MTRTLAASILGSVLSVSVACAPAKTPSETYLDYHGAAIQAKTVEDLVKFMPQADRDKMAQAPASSKEFVFGLRKEMEARVVGQPKVVKEDVQGDKATLEVEAVFDYSDTNPNLGQKPAQAQIKLVKEKDGWKVVNAPNWAMK